MKKPVNYIDKLQFYNEIVKHQEKVKVAKETGLPEPRLSNYIGKAIRDIAVNLSFAPNFLNYSFKEEMIGDAIETCLKYFDRYDINEPSHNPFGYFTMVVWRAFVSRISEEEKNRYIIYKNFEETMIHVGLGDLLVDEENNLIAGKTYDNISEFIRNYERKEEVKRQKRLEKKRLKESTNDILPV